MRTGTSIQESMWKCVTPYYPELSRLNIYSILTESSVSALRRTPQPGLYLQDYTSYFIVG
jgi:hypothetical protein